MMKTTADLYSSQLTVKSDSARGIGGDFAGILFSTLTAAIYNTKVQIRRFDDTAAGISGYCRPQTCTSLQNPGKQICKEKNVSKRNGRKGESILKKKLGQNASAA